MIDAEDIAALKEQILGSGLTVSQLVSAAWASAASFRGSDKRGGANGARVRLEPQRSWEVNNPAQLDNVIGVLEGVRQAFNSAGKQVSLADVIVLGGCAAVEKAAKEAGFEVEVPFTPGRVDASQEQTDVESFEALEPKADGFRNYVKAGVPAPGRVPAHRPRQPAHPERARDDGARWWSARARRQLRRLLDRRPHRHAGRLTNDFFVNLLDLGTNWTANNHGSALYSGTGANGESWTAQPR